MWIRRLEVNNLRALVDVDIGPADGLSVFYGRNGSGKTSILEAIHLLGTGRSFRSRRVGDVIRRGEKQLRVRGEVVEADAVVSIGVEHGENGLRIRSGGETLRTASALARRLPMMLISPDSQRLVSDGAAPRRRLMDWMLFHVEREYWNVFQRFRRALRQRNAQLQAQEPTEGLVAWNRELGAAGDAVHAMRSAWLEAVLPRYEAFVRDLVGLEVTMRYLAGWDASEPLAQVLARTEGQDRVRGFTDRGPQRADLRFTVDGRPVQHVLSRGESKLFVLGLQLAQVDHLASATGSAPVLLVDELASELDLDSRRRVFEALREIGAQTCVTSVARELVECSAWPPGKLFHVEQGTVQEMV